MRRRAAAFILVFVCFILQNTIFQSLALASVAPNLLLAATIFSAVFRGNKGGLSVGFLCGLLIDLFFGNVLGFHMLLYSVIGYAAGSFHKVFHHEDLKLVIAWEAAFDLLYGLLVFILSYMLRGRFHFGYYMIHIILPEVIYTVIVSVVLFYPVRAANKWLKQWDDEGLSGYGSVSSGSFSAQNLGDHSEEK